MAAKRAGLDDYLIVDTDVHVHEMPADLIPYCDMPWRVSLEAIAGNAQKYLEIGYLDVPSFSPGASGSSFGPVWPSSHEANRTVLTPKAMREELSRISVDIGILFPDSMLKLPTITNDEYASALARAYNAWLVDTWCKPEQGMLGCLTACPQAPEDTAAEIEKYANHPGVVGVYLPSAAVDPLWGHKKYDPIFRAAEAADLPVMLHSVGIVHPVFPFNTHGFGTGFARHVTSHTFSMMANVIDMVTTGVPVRFPKLRIAVTEAGVSWVPFLMLRMDKVYLEKRREVPFLTERPSTYMKKFFYATQPIEEPERLKDLVTLIDLFEGENQVVFASDWPHHDFDHPNKIYQMPFSEEAKRKILGGNALRLFNIDEQGRRLALAKSVAAR
jgi:predicted TIM-barrel fold metal-dependent hydrolase